MSRAFCPTCREEVYAVARPRQVLGGYTLNSPGPIHPVMLVRAPEEFYCPNCGRSLVTEAQFKKFESDSQLSEVMFWGAAGLLLVITIGGLLVAVSTGNQFDIGIGFLLVFAVFGAYVSLLVYGERRLEGTGMMAVLAVLLIVGLSMDSRQAKELRQQEQRRVTEEKESEQREEQARQDAAVREEQRAAEAAKDAEREQQAELAATARRRKIPGRRPPGRKNAPNGRRSGKKRRPTYCESGETSSTTPARSRSICRTAMPPSTRTRPSG